MDSITPAQVNSLLRRRRSIYPQNYTAQPIPRPLIEQILENANWAPSHKLTEPWRFRVFHSEASRQRLADYLGDWYQQHTAPEKFSDMQYDKARIKPLQSACVIAICMQRDPQERLPEWEELAAVACAVQNMWLSCTANHIGSYWSSPESILEADEFLGLGPGERCLGLFYMGFHEMPEVPGKRRPLSEKTVWYEE